MAYVPRQALKQEVAWATHLGLHAVLFPTPRFHSYNYAHIINHVASNLSYMKAWVKIPLVAPEVLLQVVSLREPSSLRLRQHDFLSLDCAVITCETEYTE